jgi:ABC-type branched-subunit amino acid transport system permease subunit
VLATIAGSFYAQQAGFISPDTFSMWVNILAVVMLCVGGPATSLGPILGAAIMTVLPYLLITVQTYTVLMQGLILLVVLRFVPDGVMGIIDKHLIRRGGKGNG